MSRYTVIPGQVDAFNRVNTWTVWRDEQYPFAICKDEGDADQVAAALNGAEPVVEPAPADPDWSLCPRGGDHDYKGPVKFGEHTCSKCGYLHEMPF